MKHEPVHDNILCHICWKEIPRFSDIGNDRSLLQQRFPLIYNDDVSFYGLYLFSKKGHVQNILHQVKYNGKSHWAFELGKLLGKTLSIKNYHGIIYVPMHYKKLRRRGYNQAEFIAKGISEITKIPIYGKALKKTSDTDSLTKMDRANRHSIVMKSYSLDKPLPENVKSILLVDDVITTGATLEICSQLLKSRQDVQIDYAFIAMAITS